MTLLKTVIASILCISIANGSNFLLYRGVPVVYEDDSVFHGAGDNATPSSSTPSDGSSFPPSSRPNQDSGQSIGSMQPPSGVNPLIGADTPPSEYGALLSQGAYDSIDISTAGIPGTQGGNLGCAAATCIMFQNTTGQQLVPGRDMVLGTGQLYSSLSNDSRFVAVSLDNAQPGDIVVTAKNSATGRAGHTGIVGNNGRIISNSSGGFQGSSPGTIQNNYSVSEWQRSVTTRNPNQTMAFRYIGG